MKAADYILVSSDNLPEYRELMMEWIGEGKELVICTHGKRGATALTKEGKWIEMPIISDYELKDANGAGDSFFSGLLYGYLKGETVIDCMKYATVVAGLCINSYELASEQLSVELVEAEYNKYFSRDN